MNAKIVSQKEFERKLERVSFRNKLEIINYMVEQKKQIKQYRFGIIPGYRVFQIVTNDGTIKEWRIKR